MGSRSLDGPGRARVGGETPELAANCQLLLKRHRKFPGDAVRLPPRCYPQVYLEKALSLQMISVILKTNKERLR